MLRMGQAMVDLYCASFQVPNTIVLDVDDTLDAVHGKQQGRLFIARRRTTGNAHDDEYGFQPIVVLDGSGRFITARLRLINWPCASSR